METGWEPILDTLPVLGSTRSIARLCWS